MTRWNRRLLFGVLAVLVPALAGCEAGLNAPTLEFHPAAFGAYADKNGISISNAFVLGLDGCSTLEVAGLNVATDSIAPATRHTARMLASSGITLPRAAKGAKGPASRRSRVRRRCARSSRW